MRCADIRCSSEGKTEHEVEGSTEGEGTTSETGGRISQLYVSGFGNCWGSWKQCK